MDTCPCLTNEQHGGRSALEVKPEEWNGDGWGRWVGRILIEWWCTLALNQRRIIFSLIRWAFHSPPHTHTHTQPNRSKQDPSPPGWCWYRMEGWCVIPQRSMFQSSSYIDTIVSARLISCDVTKSQNSLMTSFFWLPALPHRMFATPPLGDFPAIMGFLSEGR